MTNNNKNKNIININTIPGCFSGQCCLQQQPSNNCNSSVTQPVLSHPNSLPSSTPLPVSSSSIIQPPFLPPTNPQIEKLKLQLQRQPPPPQISQPQILPQSASSGAPAAYASSPYQFRRDILNYRGNQRAQRILHLGHQLQPSYPIVDSPLPLYIQQWHDHQKQINETKLAEIEPENVEIVDAKEEIDKIQSEEQYAEQLKQWELDQLNIMLAQATTDLEQVKNKVGDERTRLREQRRDTQANFLVENSLMDVIRELEIEKEIVERQANLESEHRSSQLNKIMISELEEIEKEAAAEHQEAQLAAIREQVRLYQQAQIENQRNEEDYARALKESLESAQKYENKEMSITPNTEEMEQINQFLREIDKEDDGADIVYNYNVDENDDAEMDDTNILHNTLPKIEEEINLRRDLNNHENNPMVEEKKDEQGRTILPYTVSAEDYINNKLTERLNKRRENLKTMKIEDIAKDNLKQELLNKSKSDRQNKILDNRKTYLNIPPLEGDPSMVPPLEAVPELVPVTPLLTEPARRPVPVPALDLLSAIRTGAKLKKTVPNTKPILKSDPLAGLRTKMEARRQEMLGEDNPEIKQQEPGEEEWSEDAPVMPEIQPEFIRPPEFENEETLHKRRKEVKREKGKRKIKAEIKEEGKIKTRLLKDRTELLALEKTIKKEKRLNEGIKRIKRESESTRKVKRELLAQRTHDVQFNPDLNEEQNKFANKIRKVKRETADKNDADLKQRMAERRKQINGSGVKLFTSLHSNKKNRTVADFDF